jgi:outer membrane protein
VDVLGARVDVASQEQSLARARDEAKKLRLALLQAMGLPPRDVDAFALAHAQPDTFDPAALDADALVELALRANPAVLQRQAAATAADRRASAARGVRWPSLDANFGYNRYVREPGLFDAFGRLEAQDRGFSFGLSASLPLFSNFRTAASIAQADAAREDAREDERASRLLTERDVRSALIDLENAHGQLRLAEQKAALSAERLELATEQYRLGALTFLNLQRVIDETANAERQALEARYVFALARVTLEERLGAPLPQP